MKMPNLDSLVPHDVTPRLGELQGITEEAVTGFPAYKHLAPDLNAVWEVSYPLLVRVDLLKINPVAHHLVVFLFCLEAGAGSHTGSEPLDAEQMRRLLTLAQIHDSSAEMKITKTQVRELRERDQAAGNCLEIRRLTGRWRHLAESMSNAIELLSLANHILRQPAYDYAAMERLALDCSCHDYPSMGRLLPEDKDSLLPVFVECDALWMISHPHGPRADFLRDDKSPSRDDLIKRIQNNTGSIAERCGVKKAAHEELTRLPATKAIARRHLDRWAEELKVDVGVLFQPLGSKEGTK